MNFELTDELRLFAESVRAAVREWEAPREPELGEWQDDRDPALDERLRVAGWAELSDGDDLLGAAVAGGLELGRAVAPLCVLDEATLGATLWVAGRARHALAAERVVVPLAGGGLALASPATSREREATLDGTGTVRTDVAIGEEFEPGDARARWGAWSAATLGYAAGLGERALELAVEHVRARQQFGAPLAALPAVQSRLADAALAVEATRLLAWSRDEAGVRTASLLWATSASCDVAASALQVHGALAFALESGLHVFPRRANAVRAWTVAACDALR